MLDTEVKDNGERWIVLVVVMLSDKGADPADGVGLASSLLCLLINCSVFFQSGAHTYIITRCEVECYNLANEIDRGAGQPRLRLC